MKWHKINDITKITTHNLYVFVSTKESKYKYKYQVIMNSGQVMDTWRSRFKSHEEIKEQVELFVDDLLNN